MITDNSSQVVVGYLQGAEQLALFVEALDDPASWVQVRAADLELPAVGVAVVAVRTVLGFSLDVNCVAGMLSIIISIFLGRLVDWS